jgi:hypothetical protein
MNDPTTAGDWSRKHATMLRAERAVLAELLLSLAAFEGRSLHRELGLSRGMSHYRHVAVRLVQRFPEVVDPIRDGRLCLTTVVELARVMTVENRAEVLPRFFHRSRDEAKQVAAEIAPREVVPRRTVVTEILVVPARAQASSTAELQLIDARSSSTR